MPAHGTMPVMLETVALALPALAVSLALMAVAWIVSLWRNDASVVDPFWPLAALGIAATNFALAEGAGPRALLILTLTALWALRLTRHLGVRWLTHRHEDKRYARMREAVGAGFAWKSLYLVFGLQAVAIWAVCAPVHAAIWEDNQTIGLLSFAGVILFCFGFLVEAEADRQLSLFKANPFSRGGLCTAGLWAWSRHPNYFGEMVLWWGLCLIALEGGAWWSALGPALLTFLLLRVSGVPLTERMMEDRPGMEAYRRRTAPFWPKPPSKTHSSRHRDPT